ncbi:MAG: molybdenum cofactor guanylyltransferase [Syntrophomonadaceae bacterium]|nr:molybdenum cofactor guanylyltransferase [Syntrophomonadaceae bacterium]
MRSSSIVLAGGRSSRMRSNKAFIEVRGQRIIDNIIGKLSDTFDEIVLVTNDPDLYKEYAGGKIRLVSDILPGKGPLSGIHTGLSYAKHDRAFTVPCDMPFLSMDFALHMVNKIGTHHGVVPRIDGYFQPLCAAYSKSCLPIIESSLHKGHLKISGVYELLDILYLDEEEISKYGNPDVMFHNVNSRDDLRMAEAIG